MTMTDSLLALRDVEGVLGSFVIDENGALMAKDLPAVFYPELFKDVGPRLLRLRERRGRRGRSATFRAPLQRAQVARALHRSRRHLCAQRATREPARAEARAHARRASGAWREGAVSV